MLPILLVQGMKFVISLVDLRGIIMDMGTWKWNKDKNDIHSTYLSNTQVVIDFWGIKAAQLRILLIWINVYKVWITRCYWGPRKANLCCNHFKNVSICSIKLYTTTTQAHVNLYGYIPAYNHYQTRKQAMVSTYYFPIWKETYCLPNKVTNI